MVSIRMRRSKLEMQIDILKILARNRPLKLTHIMYETNINCIVLKRILGFLVQQNLVEEKTLSKKRIVYTITERSRTILKHFMEVNGALQMTMEANKS